MLLNKTTLQHYRLAILGILLVSLALAVWTPRTQAASGYIMVMNADGAIVPAMENYIDRALDRAENDNVALTIIQLDTPGGSVLTTEDIIQRIRGADIPVVVYVSPRGAMAASAGALITLSGHLSAMAPETVIGAASPINSDGSDLDDTSDRKAKEILMANMRSLTENRNRDAQNLAVAMIEDAEAVTASEAFAIGLIDAVADDVSDLIAQLDGKTAQLEGRTVTLELTGLDQRTVNMNLIERLLLMLTDPTLVFFLLSTGVLLVIIEFRAPGGWVAGTLGAIMIATSLYGLGVLPVNFLGLVFIALAFGLFVLEIHIPDTQGALTVAASISLAVGGLIMFNNTDVRQFGTVSLVLIIGQSLGLAVLGVLLTTWMVRTIKGQPLTGISGMIGLIGEVMVALEPRGIVFVHGERWRAETINGLHVEEGMPVRVVEVDGLVVKVEPLDPVKFPAKKKKA